jgi:hypothetical protein
MTDLELSHFGTDAQDQWQRVLRWHSRLRPIREGEPAELEALDDLWAFFNNCNDLTHWVIRAGVRRKDAVHAFVEASEPLKICRDIANGVTHYRLSPLRQTTTHGNWTTATYFTYAGYGDELHETAHRVFVLDQGERFTVTATRDLFAIADECVAAWRRFLDVGPGKKNPFGLRIGPH